MKELTKNYIALNVGCETREMSKKFKFCPRHINEYLRFFCEDCEVTFCPSCIVEHSGHAFCEQKFSSELVLKKLTALKDVLSDKTKLLTVSKMKIDEQLKQLEAKSGEELKLFEESI